MIGFWGSRGLINSNYEKRLCGEPTPREVVVEEGGGSKQALKNFF